MTIREQQLNELVLSIIGCLSKQCEILGCRNDKNDYFKLKMLNNSIKEALIGIDNLDSPNYKLVKKGGSHE